jgi:antitoxin PrlF
MPSNKPTVSMESVAKLTSKNHTTLPIAVRKALDVGPHDWISSTVLEGGKVEVTKAEDLDSDPVVRQYLAFLEEDMIAHPEQLSVIQRDDTMRKLLQGVESESFDLSS